MEISIKKIITLLLINIYFISFSSAQIQEIDEVNIISNRAQNQSGIKIGYVIDQYEIQNAPVQSIEDLLEYAINIDLRQRGIDGIQSDISIRGGSFEQVLILLNGIKINDPQTGHHSMNIPVSIQQIEKIEILTGGATRIYGNYAYTGVINVITKKEAIIFTSSVVVNSAPTTNSTNLFSLHSGSKIEILDTIGEWINIKIANGKNGWIKKSDCKTLK